MQVTNYAGLLNVAVLYRNLNRLTVFGSVLSLKFF